MASLERDVESERHTAAAERKKLADLTHERDVLNKLHTQVCAWVGLGVSCSRAVQQP
jgi:hypothetical protein